MPTIITVTVPDGTDAAEYLHRVADEHAEGYTSGHVGPDHHWTQDAPSRRIWTAAVHGDESPIGAGVYATQRAAYLSLLDCLPADVAAALGPDPANHLIADALDELPLFSWSVDVSYLAEKD